MLLYIKWLLYQLHIPLQPTNADQINQVNAVSAVGLLCWATSPDSKVHAANMGPIWGRQDPGGLHVGPMNFAIWEGFPTAAI